MTPSSRAAQAAIETPCTGVCAMDRRGFCIGCARTLEEIGAWLFLSASARLSIVEGLAARKAALASDSPLHPLP